MQMWSNCFNSFNSSSSGVQHSSDSDTLPIPDTPVIRNQKPGISTTAAAPPAGEDEAAADMTDGEAEDAAAAAVGGDTHMVDTSAASNTSSSSTQPLWLAASQVGLQLGEPDCELLGPGWKLQAHKQVLKGMQQG